MIGLLTNIGNIINFRPWFFSCFDLDPQKSDQSRFSIGFPYIQMISYIVQFQNQNDEKTTDEN